MSFYAGTPLVQPRTVEYRLHFNSQLTLVQLALDPPWVQRCLVVHPLRSKDEAKPCPTLIQQQTPATSVVKLCLSLFWLRFCHLYILGGISSISIALFYLMDKD